MVENTGWRSINQHLCPPLYRNRQPKLRNVRSERRWDRSVEREARKMQANAEHTAHLAIWRSLAKVNRRRGRGREKERIPWNWLTSWLSRGLRNNFVPSNQPPPLCTPRPRTSLAHPYNREARIGKGYITFRSTYNEARAYQGEPVRSLSFNTSDADDVNVLADFLSCRARSRYQFFSSRRCERRTNIFHTFS